MRIILKGVVLLISLSLCCEMDMTMPPQSMPEKLVDNAYNYVTQHVDWINRDGWTSINGSTRHSESVSYNKYEADSVSGFIQKIDDSKVLDQVYWSQYTSYFPGGRFSDDPDILLWAGTSCCGLVYRSGIEAGYSIYWNCLNNVNEWLYEGDVIPWESVQIGDIILMDFDNDLTDWSHVGIIKEKSSIDSTQDKILSAMGLYSDPFWYKAGTHTILDYNNTLPELNAVVDDPPPDGFQVYHAKYIKLSETE